MVKTAALSVSNDLTAYCKLVNPLTGLNLTPHSLITKYPAFGSIVGVVVPFVVALLGLLVASAVFLLGWL